MTEGGTLPGWLRQQLEEVSARQQTDPPCHKHGRQAWLDEIGGLPPPADVVRGPVSSLGGLRFLSLNARFAHGAVAEGAMLVPDGQMRGAVLAFHDHGGRFDLGWRKLFPLPEARDWQDRLYDGKSPVECLARHGFAVAVFDAQGWGGRKLGVHSDQQALAANLMQAGISPAALIAAEDLAVARWFTGEPEAAEGLGVWGFSFGAFRAWQAAALCPDIPAAAAISWMGRRTDLLRSGAPMTAGQSAFWTLHPGLANALDYPDMAGLVAPRRLFLRCGTEDQHFPDDTYRASVARMATFWRQAGAESALDAASFEGGHVCPAAIIEASCRFLSG